MAMHSAIRQLVHAAPATPEARTPLLRPFLRYRDAYRTRHHKPRERRRIAYDALWALAWQAGAAEDRARIYAIIIRMETDGKPLADDAFRLAYTGYHFL
jgi:hypothetical protein